MSATLAEVQNADGGSVPAETGLSPDIGPAGTGVTEHLRNCHTTQYTVPRWSISALSCPVADMAQCVFAAT